VRSQRDWKPQEHVLSQPVGSQVASTTLAAFLAGCNDEIEPRTQIATSGCGSTSSRIQLAFLRSVNDKARFVLQEAGEFWRQTFNSFEGFRPMQTGLNGRKAPDVLDCTLAE
jgi:hypothetical protein